MSRPALSVTRTLVAFIMLLHVLNAPTQANADPAGDALARGHYATAMQLWLRRAEQGDAGAMTNVGYMHEQGLAVRQDYREAMRWYRQAVATSQQPQALHNLGMLYHHGYGVEQNHREANYFFAEAAAQNLADSQHMLGIAHYEGLGETPNPQEALSWFLRAATQGFGPAQYMVAYLLLSGDLGREDAEGAWIWASVALTTGYADGVELRGLSELRIDQERMNALAEQLRSCLDSAYRTCPET